MIAHGGFAKGIPKNFWVIPSDFPVNVPLSSLRLGDAVGAAATQKIWKASPHARRNSMMEPTASATFHQAQSCDIIKIRHWEITS